MLPDTKQQVIEKIRKLLALAKSSNQHEAELAAQHASRLMTKHQIDSASVEESEIRAGRDGVVSFDYVVKDQKMKLHWVTTLAHAAAALYDGTILINRRLHGTSFTFVGFRSEIPLMVDLFEHLYESWFRIVEQDLERAKSDYLNRPTISLGLREGWQPRDTMKFKHGHGQGFAMALLTRCSALAEERRAAVRSTSTALVLLRTEAVETWKKQNGVRTIKTTQTKGDVSGFHAGSTAGRSIALNGARLT